MPDIILSERYGVNVAITICYFCVKPKNEIVLPGRLPGDAEAPQHVCWNKEPCDECAGFMKQGVILISVRSDAKDSDNNPYRTGGWCVVRDEVIERLASSPELRDGILKARVAFVPDDAWDKIGLPRGNVPEGRCDDAVDSH